MRDPHVSDADLVTLADGECSPARASEVRQHLEACWSCRARAQALDSVVAGLVTARHRSLDDLVPPAEAPRAMFRARLAAEPSPARPAWRRMGDWTRLSSPSRTLPVRVIAASIVVLVIGVVSILVSWSSPVAELEAHASPSAELTPGAALLVSREAVCGHDVTTGPPRVSRAVALSVFRTYGIRDPAPRAYELDYLVAPELGGSTDVRNLWPQAYGGTWNARLKDALEDRLRELVCSGALDLRTAQTEIATDWIASYKKHFATDAPIPAHRSFVKDQPWR